MHYQSYEYKHFELNVQQFVFHMTKKIQNEHIEHQHELVFVLLQELRKVLKNQIIVYHYHFSEEYMDKIH